MQDKSEKASPVNTKNGFVRNTLQTSTRKIYRNRKKPERKTQREGPKKTRFFRPDLPIRPITGFFRKNSGVEKSRNLPRPPLSEKRHRPTPSEHRKMTLHLAGGIFFAIFVKDRRRFGNLSVRLLSAFTIFGAGSMAARHEKQVRSFYAVLAFTAFS